MKTVGIMTWYFGANYGAMAQATALYETVRALGYHCTMINYRPKGYRRTILSSNLPPKYKRLLRIKETVNGLIKIGKLSDFSHFDESKKVSGPEEINELGLHHIIFGSDAIFNTRHRLFNPVYYGVGIHSNKFTYSPSCEFLSPDTELQSEVVQSLKEMKAISVRDENTFHLIKNNTGIDAIITLDPTFLYDFNEYKSSLGVDRYILIYSFSGWNEYKDQIQLYAKKKGLPIICVGRECKWADLSLPASSFHQWIASFRNAELVVTDSFHGTVFSLKNKKQIVLCGRADKKSKISSLLSQIDASIDVYEGENLEDYLKDNQIDYSLADKSINKEVEKSRQFIVSALNK